MRLFVVSVERCFWSKETLQETCDSKSKTLPSSQISAGVRQVNGWMM